MDEFTRLWLLWYGPSGINTVNMLCQATSSPCVKGLICLWNDDTDQRRVQSSRISGDLGVQCRYSRDDPIHPALDNVDV